jgi:DNA gyrase subunit B
MKAQLLELGLSDSVLEAGDGRTVEGAEMTQLCRTLASLEEELVALERRGISLRQHAERQEPESLKLPVYHVFLGTHEHWFTSRAQLDAFLEKQSQATGGELDVADTPAEGHPEGNGDAAVAARLHIVELHEVRSINALLADLASKNFDIQSLIPQERTGIEDPRYTLRRGEAVIPLEDLRSLVAAVRKAGEKGLSVTRFKGLGEMNAEELKETTLDPENRTLLQVKMDDVAAADELFRVLMGDKVEPRREYIQKHALEVKNLDV